MANRDLTFYRRLRTLLRRPSVRSKVFADRPANRFEQRMFNVFARAASNQYMQSLAGSTERLARTRDYELMDISSSIIHTALNIWADDCTTYNEDGMVLKVKSPNARVERELHELFYDRLNVDYNLWHWIRNMCKYGDFFLLLDVIQDEGIVSHMPLPTVEIEREEGYDGDINSVRFRWNAASAAIFDNYQVAHFRIIGDDTFLPYGKSNLESGRRTWKQLNMIEDAMLVYRIQRAPERRVFKIDVGNISPNDIPGFIQKAKDILKRSPLIDSTGNVDLRFNVHSQEEDYFLPVRGRDSGTEIGTLPGATNLGDIDDVRYVQNNLIAALGIPRAYLTFEEQLQGKTTLSQEDMRFARTIQRLQKLAISELNKVAMIHLYALGFQDADDLTSFKLSLANPSQVQEQMKMELMGSKFNAFSTAVQSVGVDREWAQRKILRLNEEEIKKINLGVARDTKWKAELEVVAQKVQQANAPQQPQGGEQQKGGSEAQQQAIEPGQPPTDIIPGGDAAPPINTFSKTNAGSKNTKSAFSNSPNSPMSGSSPSRKKEVDEEAPPEPKVSDLFDPNDSEDREILNLAKKYDWLGKTMHERAKVSREVTSIFTSMDKRIKGKKDENQ